MPKSRRTERTDWGEVNEDLPHSLETTTPLIREDGSTLHFKPVPIAATAATGLLRDWGR